ncbi:MAG: stage III sporulation protein AA [Eubacteriales bacterium]|nr:stage III sporulation protein AA [Eubacteriales bacterium]
MTEAHWKQGLSTYFPKRLWELLLEQNEAEPLEEIRLRAGQGIQLVYAKRDTLINTPVSGQDCEAVLERMCEHSLYAWREEMRAGFITLSGGYRVGLCGKALVQEGKMLRFSHITSLNIRIARAVLGAADSVMPYITEKNGQVHSTLLFSSPGCGKTTVLRDAVRQLSYGGVGKIPCRVCVMDERMELCAGTRGIPQMDLGPRTDVLCGCGKAEGMRLLIRSMNPQVLVTDELGGAQEASAVLEAAVSGVKVITTAHADSMEHLYQRQSLRRLLEENVFSRIVQLGRDPTVGTLTGVWDAAKRPVLRKVEG